MAANYEPVIGDRAMHRTATMTAAGYTGSKDNFVHAFNREMRLEIDMAALTPPDISPGQKATSASAQNIISTLPFGNDGPGLA